MVVHGGGASLPRLEIILNEFNEPKKGNLHKYFYFPLLGEVKFEVNDCWLAGVSEFSSLVTFRNVSLPICNSCTYGTYGSDYFMSYESFT